MKSLVLEVLPFQQGGPRMRVLALALSFIVLATVASAKSISDQHALQLATAAVKALTGGSTVTDITLSATVTHNTGDGTETGTATLQAKGSWESRADLVLVSGERIDTRNNFPGSPQGFWTDKDGNRNVYPDHACTTDASWFFSALSSLNWAADPGITLTYLGQQTLGGQLVEHIQATRFANDGSKFPGPTFQQLSATDFYLDAITLLPVSVTYNVHPDNDANTNIPIVLMFLNYTLMNGMLVPAEVQEYYQGSLFLDFTITSAVANSNLPDTLFQ